MRENGAIQIGDRARGCILAGAIGDAMGGPFEGQRGPLEFHESANWSISDDSQLTLATCESIIQVGEVSPEHIAGRFLNWYRARQITGWVQALSKHFATSMLVRTGLWPEPEQKCLLGTARQCGSHRSHSILIRALGRRTWGKHEAKRWVRLLRTAVSEQLA